MEPPLKSICAVIFHKYCCTQMASVISILTWADSHVIRHIEIKTKCYIFDMDDTRIASHYPGQEKLEFYLADPLTIRN